MNKNIKKNTQIFLYEYIKIACFKSDENSLKTSKEVFLLATADYFKGKIEVKDYTGIAIEIYYELNKPSDFNWNSSLQELGNMLNLATELEHNFKDNREFYESSVSKIKKYLEKQVQATS